MRRLFCFSLTAMLIGCVLGPPAQISAAEPLAILLIGKQPDHPVGSHAYLATCELLARELREQHGYSATVSDGWPKDEQLTSEVDCVVIYADTGAEIMFGGPQAGAVRKLFERPVGLVTLHWSCGVKEANTETLGKPFQELLGGRWLSAPVPPVIGKSPLRVLAPDHPISAGWQLAEIADEFYPDPQLLPAATPLWEVDLNGAPLVIAWAYERPTGGRSFATTLGHFERNFTDDQFRRAVVNGIAWSAEGSQSRK
jgi:type 1 glutamine amidotransferase